MRRKVFKSLAKARKFAKAYKVNDITVTICNTKLIYIVEYKPNSFTLWWLKNNYKTLIVMIINIIIISWFIYGIWSWCWYGHY